VGYWTWYLVIAIFAWAFKLPWLALLAPLVLFGRRWIPDPVEFVASWRQIRALERRVGGHPADLVARRDLARMYVTRRPRHAIALLEEAIAKGLDEPEAYFLLGLARVHAGEFEAALEPIVRSVARKERFAMGEPYFVAAEALQHLQRFGEAEDALERGLAINTSRIDAQISLADVREAQGRGDEAREALRAAVDGWHELPEFLRWKLFHAYLLARWRLRRIAR
jgi:tetratricopeptide (TPR) repeat protein